ncbi:hypothetical protein [Fictibacillus phosphorivorans]
MTIPSTTTSATGTFTTKKKFLIEATEPCVMEFENDVHVKIHFNNPDDTP